MDALKDCFDRMANEDQERFVYFAPLLAQNPQAALDGLTIAQHEPSAAREMAEALPRVRGAVDIYVTDLEERCALLWDCGLRLHTHAAPRGISAMTIAIFMVAPLSALRPAVERVMDSASAFQLLGTLGVAGGAVLDCKFEQIGILCGAVHALLTFFGLSVLCLPPAKPRTEECHKPTLPATASPARAPFAPVTSSPLKRSAEVANLELDLDADESAQPAENPPCKMLSGHRRHHSDPAPQPKTPLGLKPSNASPPLPLPASPTNSGRSRNAVMATKARDGDRCVLTHVCMPDNAHIFPFSATVNDAAKRRFATLFLFWGEERARSWKALYEDKGVIESPQNVLTLGKHMHAMWSKAMFALKPLSATANELVVQFHWLKRGTARPGDVIGDLSLDSVMHLVGGGDDGWGPAQVAHHDSGIPIQTGDLFTIRADTPENLPSSELLKLQWDLLRVAAMCGAADIYEDRDDDDDDDWWEQERLRMRRFETGSEYEGGSAASQAS